MNPADYQYMRLVHTTQDFGTVSENRTGVDTTKVFGQFLSFNVRECYPLLTQKKVFHRGLHIELFWFLDGANNIQDLLAADVHIWDGWANAHGDLGPVYGEQWRACDDIHMLRHNDPYFETKRDHLNKLSFMSGADPAVQHEALQGQSWYRRIEGPDYVLYARKYDQIANAIYRLKNFPDCRRIIVDAWNPSVIPVDGLKPSEQPAIGKQSLPACHTLFQFGSAVTKNSFLRAGLCYMDIEVREDKAFLFGNPTGMTLDELTKDKATLISVARDHDHEYGPLVNMRELSLHMHQRSTERLH